MRNVRILRATTDMSDDDTLDVIPMFPVDTFIISGRMDCSKTLLWCRFNDEYGDVIADGLELRVDSGVGNVHCLYYIGGNFQRRRHKRSI